MSVMQAIKLLRFVKGVTVFHTPWNPTENGYYRWLLSINESGCPVNLTIGIYNKEHREKLGKGYIYLYILGKRWFKRLDKKNKG